MLATADVIAYWPGSFKSTPSDNLGYYDLYESRGVALNGYICVHGKAFTWADYRCDKCAVLCQLMRANIRKRWLAGEIVTLDTEIMYVREAVQESNTSIEFELLGIT